MPVWATSRAPQLFLSGDLLFTQAEKLAGADSSPDWHFETLMGALLLVPNWVGCSRGNHPSSFKFGKAFAILFSLLCVVFTVFQKGFHVHRQTALWQSLYSLALELHVVIKS